jgi:phosphatidylglycerol:prolipoprotein diacylglycerol transferase
MHPELFNIKGIVIYTYGFFVSLGFLAGFLLFLLEAKRNKKSVDTAIDLSFWVLLSAIVFSRLFYVLLNLRFFLEYPLRIFMVWEGGLVWYGAFFGAVIAAAIYFRGKKLDGWHWADMAAPGIVLGQAIGRIGCLMAGCCYGRPTNLPWGICFTQSEIAPSGIPLHPTQVYSMLLNLLIFCFLFYRRKKVKFRGELILSYVILYAAGRSIVELFRGDPRGYWFWESVSSAQVIGVIAIICAVFFYIRIREKNRIDTKKESGTSKKSKNKGNKQ